MSTVVNKNRGLLEAALEIDRRRRNTLVLAKQAVRKGDLKEADRLLTELVPDDKEMSGATEGKHVRAGRRGKSILAFSAGRKPTNR